MPDAPGINPKFEALHPRDKTGADAGQFVDVIGQMQALGGEWNEPRGVWVFPKDRRSELDSVFANIGYDVIDVPEGMRPATIEDRRRLKVPPAWTDVMVSDQLPRAPAAPDYPEGPLSGKAIVAVANYTSGSTSWVNGPLRGGDGVETRDDLDYVRRELFDDTVNGLDEAISKQPSVPGPMTVWRGDEAFLDVQVGDVLPEHGFASTTQSEEAVSRFGGVVAEIRLPAGSRVLDTNAVRNDASGFARGHTGEHEVILPRGGSYRVVAAGPKDKHILGNKRRVTLEWIPPDDGTDAGPPVEPPGVKLLARGRDQVGRIQPIYSKEHHATQAAKKFARVKAMSGAMPAVDEALARDALGDDTAAAMMVVRKLGLRPGSNRDTRSAKQAFGASTLQRRHVQVTGNTVRLAFVGKKGVDINLQVDDPELARVLRQRMKGKSGEERLFDTNENLMRRWLEGAAPGFKPKDFRTHLGTSEALGMVRDLPPPTTPAEAKKYRNQVGDYVSGLLGNTRAVALASYINPSVFSDWEGLL